MGRPVDGSCVTPKYWTIIILGWCIGMVYLAEEAALSLEHDAVSRACRVYDGRVEEFGRAGQLSEHGLTHLTVCPRAECLVTQNAN